jgi:hypothetical protein
MNDSHFSYKLKFIKKNTTTRLLLLVGSSSLLLILGTGLHTYQTNIDFFQTKLFSRKNILQKIKQLTTKIF